MYLLKCLRGMNLQAEGQPEGTRWSRMSCAKDSSLFLSTCPSISAPSSKKASAESPLFSPLIFGMFAFTGKGHELLLILSVRGKMRAVLFQVILHWKWLIKTWGITHSSPQSRVCVSSSFESSSSSCLDSVLHPLRSFQSHCLVPIIKSGRGLESQAGSWGCPSS